MAAARKTKLLHRPGSPFPNGYRSDAVQQGWPVGEERAVDAETAEYLLETFPGAFVEAGARKAAGVNVDTSASAEAAEAEASER